jgi:hypothetical protein
MLFRPINGANRAMLRVRPSDLRIPTYFGAGFRNEFGAPFRNGFGMGFRDPFGAPVGVFMQGKQTEMRHGRDRLRLKAQGASDQ